jgi:hypothetical protein
MAAIFRVSLIARPTGVVQAYHETVNARVYLIKPNWVPEERV